MQITFEKTFRHILAVKLWHFKRKSLLRYLLGAAMLTLGIKGFQVNPDSIVLFLILYVGLLCLSLTAILFSARMQSRNYSSAVVEFTDDSVTITDSPSAPPVTLPWSEVRCSEDSRNLYIRTSRNRRFYYRIPKDKLAEPALKELRELLARKCGD